MRDAGNMRTLLKKISTGSYFQGPDQWTNDPVQAFDFKSIDHGLQFVQKWKLKGVELVFAFKNSRTVRRVPAEKISIGYDEET
jgi:hypothetical protein